MLDQLSHATCSHLQQAQSAPAGVFRQAGRCYEGHGGHCRQGFGQGSDRHGSQGGQYLHYLVVGSLSVTCRMHQIIPDSDQAWLVLTPQAY